MPFPSRILTFLGVHGPLFLIISLPAGACLAPLGVAASYWLPVSAFLLTLGSFLTAGLSPIDERNPRRLVALCLLWAGLGVPTLALCAIHFLGLEPEIGIGVLLSALAPPVGSAAAIASILGLKPRLALISSITLTLLSPLTIPSASMILGLGLSVDIHGLTTRLAVIITLAAGVSFVVQRYRGMSAQIIPDAKAAAGIAVIGLMIVGATTSNRIRDQYSDTPETVIAFLGAALCVNIVLCGIGALLFSIWGKTIALTTGLVSGNRNVTLAWAAAGATLPPTTQTYVAASVVPILVLPLVLKWALSRRSSRSEP